MGRVRVRVTVMVMVIILTSSHCNHDHHAALAFTNEADVDALNTLYVALNTPPLRGWMDFGGDPCAQKWEGITCGNDSRVTVLKLSGMNLTGELGFVFSTMTSLTSLDMSKNLLSGSIPFLLSPTLQELNLAGNQFSGTLPNYLEDLSQLIVLNISHNALSGSVPDIFDQLTSLVRIDLSGNYFRGSLPMSFHNLSKLRILYLQNNRFNGTLDVLVNLSLKELDVSNNTLSGVIPVSLLSIPFFKASGNSLIAAAPFIPPPPPPPPHPPPPPPFTIAPPPLYNGPSVVGSIPAYNTPTNARYPPSSSALSPYKDHHIPSEVAALPSFSVITKQRLKEACIVAITTAAVLGFLATLLALLICSWKICKRTANNMQNPSQLDHILPPPRDGLKSFPFAPGENMSPKTSASSGPIGNAFPDVNVTAYTLSELKVATKNFGQQSLIGEGSLGQVYKAQFPNGQVLVVKKLNNIVRRVPEEAFVNMLLQVCQLHSPNITELAGFCMEQGECLLVYTHVRNGTLYDALHSSEERSSTLTWNARMRVALGAARALEYLHEVCQPSIIHRNFKSSNILLNEDFEPQVTDSGLAALVPFESGHRAISIQHFNSFGYSAPEYTLAGLYTAKSDVYSFGVVMLELLTGCKPLDRSRPQSLVQWALPQLHDMDALSRMVDPALHGIYPAKSLLLFADIILHCIQREPDCRPQMSEVTQVLVKLMQRGFSMRNSREDVLSSSLRFMHVGRQASSSPSNGT